MTTSKFRKLVPTLSPKVLPIWAPIFMMLMMNSASVKADLSEAMECHKNLNDKTCSAVLIGNIDALKNLGYYCPDGNTSYGFLQQAWARELSKDERLQKLGTASSLLLTMQKLNLRCKK